MSAPDAGAPGSVAAAADLDAERALAIRSSGWAAPVRLWQPRNLAFWVYLVVTGWGLVVAVQYVGGAAVVYGQAIEVAAVLFGLYGVLLWLFYRRVDRYAHQSRRMLVLAAVWGGLGATLALAAPANTPIISLWGKAFGQAWASDWGAGLTAPFVEELAKGAGLLLLIALVPRAVATAFDGFVLGAFIGLGFQVVEDMTHAIGSAGAQFGADPVGNASLTIALRIALGLASHAVYSAIFCTGLVYALGTSAQARRLGRGLLLMLAAMAFHGVWDDDGAILGRNTVLLILSWIVLSALAIFAATRVHAMTVGPERAYLRAVLAPEAAAGTLTQEEVETLAGDRHARRAYRRAVHGRPEHARRALVLDAARDLADELARTSGADDDRVRFARQEVARLRGA